MSDLDELRRFSDAATPGPWDRDDDEVFGDWTTDRGVVTTRLVANCDNEPANAAFIVAAVNYVREQLRTPPPVPGEGE